MKNKKLSIVMAVYNAEDYIKQSLDNIKKQTFKDYELIIVNDGSTDNTSTILNNYKNDNDNVIIIEQKNTGQGIARNVGMNKANGKYILFLDADDLYESNFLEKMVNTAEKNKSDITICNSQDFDNVSKIKYPCYSVNYKMCKTNCIINAMDMYKYIFNFSIGWAWDKLYRTNFVKKNNLKFANLRHSEDLVFVYGAYCFNPRIYIIDDILIYHRVGLTQSVSRSRSNLPLLFIDAANILSDIMQNRNVRNKFQQSFINWVVEFFYWHQDTINIENKKCLKENIKLFFNINGIYNLPYSYFYKPQLFYRLHNKKNFFYSVFFKSNKKYIKLLGVSIYKELYKNHQTEYYLFGIKIYSKRNKEYNQ
ncbi:MAG: glycosyltransferase family 2 protein [Alphaproteobacteria bacterium]|nr:glycosyltransferase family 2 protein [Alphaproteobacteria bacterium]